MNNTTAWQPVPNLDGDYELDHVQNKTATSTTYPGPEQASATYHPVHGDPFRDPDQTPNGAVITKWNHIRQDSWLWELLCLCFSTGATIAIAAVLFKFNHHPLPSWPLGITLNALISLLSVLGKASLLVVISSCLGQLKWHWFSQKRTLKDFETFDEASRGPLGSLKLLIRTTPVHLATLACVLTILALTVDPFVQQIVGYKELPVPTSNSSSYAHRAQVYDTGDFLNSGIQIGPTSGSKAAFYSGLFSSNSMSLDQADPVCTTGNCTFPPFTSLAVCSKCLNVTDQIIANKIESLGKGGTASDPNNFDDLYNATYKLPSGTVLNATYMLYPGDGSLNAGVAMTSWTQMENDASKRLFNVSSALTSISMLQFPTVDAEGYGGKYKGVKPLGWECALYFCVNTYEVSVTGGKANTSIISSWHDLEAAPIDLNDYMAGTLELPADQLEDGMTGASKNTTFTIPQGTQLALSDWLNNTLSGFMMTRSTLVPYGTYVNDVLQVLNVTADIGDLFNNVSQSMTSYIRSGIPFDRKANLAYGQAYTNQTFVHVRWPWFILPVLLLISTLVLFLATVITNKRRGDRLWKSSSLATLFHGLQIVRDESRVDSLAQMDRLAKESSFVLRQRDSSGRWVLSP